MRPRALKTALAGAALVLAGSWTASAAFSERVPVAAPLVVSAAYVERTDSVRRDETLSHLFGRHGIYGPELAEVLSAAEGLDPRRVRPGQVFAFRYVINEPKPDRVVVRLGDERILTLARDTAGVWGGESKEIAWEVRTEHIRGVIESSLWMSLDGLIPDSVLTAAGRGYFIDDLADGVFGYVIDFYRENRPGDRFNVVYERLISELGDVRFGRIVAAKVEANGRERIAYVMTDERGRNVYFDEAGRSLRRAFKLAPLPFSARISSRFSTSRLHPVLNVRRPHPGVDYAAPVGARIIATGAGRVTRAGRWGTYGIMVSIQHPGGIETRYGHMSRLASGIRIGTQVEQGQAIGYVGMTGLTNGPHVHYELIRMGRQVDPLRMQQDSGDPVRPERRAEFEALKAEYDRLLTGRHVPAATASPGN